jgi:hypothetical protein
VVATFLGEVAFIPEEVTPPQSLERTVFSCDYNGWADVPEDEREAVEAFESAAAASADPLPPVLMLAFLPTPVVPERRAA